MPAGFPQLPLSLSLRDASTFHTFEAGPNGLTVDALQALAQGEARQAWVWSHAGNGRSHLLEALVRHVLHDGRAACLLHGQELSQTLPAVLEGLEDMAVVAIDGVDVLAGDAAWEEALFHLYNGVLAAGGAMAFTADVPPLDAGFHLPDLASRMAAGPVFQLLPLPDEALVGLLRRRAAGRGLELNEELARFIVTRCARNPGALMDCLARLDREALARQRRLTQPFVKQILGW